MKLLILFLLIGIAAPSAYIGDWTSFTRINEIRDIEGSRGNLFAATSGGIRKISPSGEEKVYRNTEGLRDVGINGLASSPDGEVYAGSELGFVYQYDRSRDDWEVLTAAYRSSGWRLNTRAMQYLKGYLILGSEKGLSFFDIGKKVAAVNVTKMGNSSDISANAILFVGDTLFVGTNHGIYKATLKLEKLLTDANTNIFNPGIWSLVPGTKGSLFFNPNPSLKDSVQTKDSLAMTKSILASKQLGSRDPSTGSHGMLYYGSHGIGSEYEGTWLMEYNASASFYSPINLDGKLVGGNLKMETLYNWNGRWFCGAKYGLYEFVPGNGAFIELRNSENLPDGNIIAIRANRYGVSALGETYVYQLKGKSWKPFEAFPVRNDFNDSKIKGQHAFNIVFNSDFYVGTWGHGFQFHKDGINNTFDVTNSCLLSADATAPNYPVIFSQVPYRDKGIWMSVYLDTPYQIGFFSFETRTISCYKPKSKLLQPRSLSMVGDSILVVIGEQGAEAFSINDHGGTVGLESNNLLSGLEAAKERTLVGQADKLGNYWVTTEGSSLMYIPAVQFKATEFQSYKFLDGFPGLKCGSLEIDPQGHLWTGCASGGIFEIIPGRDSTSHTFRQYGLNDGLLSETIYHLDVNKDNGEIWVVTEKGLSRLESVSRPTQANLSSLKVYPNPFLKKHSTLVFSNLAPNSEVKVLTQGGSVVYRKTLGLGSGDQIRWNGVNQNGERVREGVYFYTVSSPKETKNGKIIVAR